MQEKRFSCDNNDDNGGSGDGDDDNSIDICCYTLVVALGSGSRKFFNLFYDEN